MGKEIDSKLWESYLSMISLSNTFESSVSFYKAVVNWIQNNRSYFTDSILKKYRLDVLLSLNPDVYAVDKLLNEIVRNESYKPKSIDVFAMMLGDRLWELASIVEPRECNNCGGLNLRYLLIKTITENELVILECEDCAWLETPSGEKWLGSIMVMKPASKFDLSRYGIR